jgi:murein DD-endopeptidase MepM/ murein hydrolase activator NlpD
MRLNHPVIPPNVSQPFDANKVPVYKDVGLSGHGAMDYSGEYGHPIYAATDSYIYSRMNFGGQPDKYRAVCTLVDDGEFIYEIIYGHVIDSSVPVKSYVKAGQVIARMGNFGNVWSSGRQVTNAERLAGSKLGTHLHFQVRKCIKVSKTKSNKFYISDSNGLVKFDNKFIEIVDYQNGYNGCVDPKPFFSYSPPLVPIPTPSQEVKTAIIALQKALVASGHLVMPPGVAYGFIGPVTLEAIKKYQGA